MREEIMILILRYLECDLKKSALPLRYLRHCNAQLPNYINLNCHALFFVKYGKCICHILQKIFLDSLLQLQAHYSAFQYGDKKTLGIESEARAAVASIAATEQ